MAALVLSFTLNRLQLRRQHAPWAQVFLVLNRGLALLQWLKQTVKDEIRLIMWETAVLSHTQNRLNLFSQHALWAQVFLVLDCGLAALSRQRQTAKDVVRLIRWVPAVFSFTRFCMQLLSRYAPWAHFFVLDCGL